MSSQVKLWAQSTWKAMNVLLQTQIPSTYQQHRGHQGRGKTGTLSWTDLRLQNQNMHCVNAAGGHVCAHI